MTRTASWRDWRPPAGWWRRRGVLVGAASLAGAGVLAAGLAGWTGAASEGGTVWSEGSAQVAGTAATGGGEAAPGRSVAPAAGTPAAGATARPAATPPPRIHDFAQDLDRRPKPVRRSPTAAVTIAEGADGCDHGYGEPTTCVPWEFPPGVTDACDWLRERGYPPLKVLNPRDRHRLDTNGDGTGCGPGD